MKLVSCAGAGLIDARTWMSFSFTSREKAHTLGQVGYVSRPRERDGADRGFLPGAGVCSFTPSVHSFIQSFTQSFCQMLAADLTEISCHLQLEC